MFDFLNMLDSYEDRKVDRYENDILFVSTAKVTDGKQEFETGIAHAQYHDNEMIIVEAYGNKEDAQKGHNKWVKIMTNKNLPNVLEDCGNAEISQLCRDENCVMVFEKQSIRKED